MRLRSLLFCAVALTMAFACSKKNYTPESTTTTQPETPIPQPPAGDADEAVYKFNAAADKVVLSHEFRGAWLATVSGTDWPKTKLNSSVQKAELTKDLEGIADAGCNVVFFQVCSNMDALWPSKLLPWSSVLTGTEGIDPGYDPTAFAVEKAHQLGLEIHAWINPYRIGATAKAHASLSPVKAHPELVKEYAGSHYLDPALPGTHAFLAEIATELMTKYPFDGLHIDDYFYPSGYNKDQKGWETQTYPLYGGGKDREEWRFSNVDASVKALCDATHAARPGAVFGVSPRSRSDLYLPQYADPARWARAGTIDYVVPQIYWTLERGDAAAFDTVLKSWNGLVGKVPVFAGIAAYKMEKSYYTQAKNEDFQFVEEFVKQVQVCRDASWCSGVQDGKKLLHPGQERRFPICGRVCKTGAGVPRRLVVRRSRLVPYGEHPARRPERLYQEYHLPERGLAGAADGLCRYDPGRSRPCRGRDEGFLGRRPGGDGLCRL